MYGAMVASRRDGFRNPYYAAALEKPSPLAGKFTRKYFHDIAGRTSGKLGLKAFLATEQRIPGLGNGCLQDILFHAGMNPQTRLACLDKSDLDRLHNAVRAVLADMAAQGGRDTEKDLFGNPGGCKTVMSNKNSSRSCPVCGSGIERKTCLGGRVYFCPTCQPPVSR